MFAREDCVILADEHSSPLQITYNEILKMKERKIIKMLKKLKLACCIILTLTLIILVIPVSTSAATLSNPSVEVDSNTCRVSFTVSGALDSGMEATILVVKKVASTGATPASNAEIVHIDQKKATNGTNNFTFYIDSSLLSIDLRVYIRGNDNAGIIYTDIAAGSFNSPPKITGPDKMSLMEGYAATATDAYAVTGTPEPTVSTEGNASITWNDTTKKLDIKAGLAEGSYPVTLTAENGVKPDDTYTFTLTITAAPVALAITSANHTTAINGMSGTFQVKATGEPPIVYSLSGQPLGVSITGSTGLIVITGTTAVGVHDFTITASNGVNSKVTQSFKLTVTEAGLNTIQFKNPAAYPVKTVDGVKFVTLPANTSVETLTGLLESAPTGYVYDITASFVGTTAGTGIKIQLVNVNTGAATDIVTVVVPSDLTGDGLANPKDLILCAQQILNPGDIILTKAQELALGEAFNETGPKRLIKLAQQILAV